MNCQDWSARFDDLSGVLFSGLKPGEYLSVGLKGENSQFTRFNNARVRQTGTVKDFSLTLTLFYEGRTAYTEFSPIGGDSDRTLALAYLEELRREVISLPEDPYIVLPENLGRSRESYRGSILPPEKAIPEILAPVEGLDFTGFYAAGEVVRANQNSLGQKHWFDSESFFLDYSLISPVEKAVKCILAGREWYPGDYGIQVKEGQELLKLLELEPRVIPPGRYRTYFAPAAVADLLGMFSWSGISESSLRHGESALNKLRDGKHLSPSFNLKEDFTAGNVPRFNDRGEMAPDEIPLIAGGKLVNTLINSRTAKEYGLVSNGAGREEGLRSPRVAPGNLKREGILAALDRGLYLSNLHYLNWSDRASGRITGMTRYACFWVENGTIVAPIKDLRFDESLYNFFGDNLVALTDFVEFIPETGTYERRSLGGSSVPGMLVEDFTFTL